MLQLLVLSGFVFWMNDNHITCRHLYGTLATMVFVMGFSQLQNILFSPISPKML